MNFRNFYEQTRSASAFIVLFIFLSFYVILRIIYENSTTHLPLYLQKYTIYDEIKDTNKTHDINALKHLLEKYNIEQDLSNADRFEPIGVGTTVIMIQVHKDIKRLHHLILSLAQVQGIHTALLIFSHSFYHPSINKLIRSIDYCKVVQIFYPYSLQLNPHKFPGVDHNDCEHSGQTNCIRRNARLTEHKQHWWWKANYVFDRMNWSRKHKNPIIFLEEYNYVAPDLLYVYPYLQRSFNYFPNVQILSFGRPLTRNNDWDLLTVEAWRPPFDVGLAFNITTWEKILSLSAQFCMYDDYSWSYSLLQLFQYFPGGHVNMVGCLNPRVVSTKSLKNTEDFIKLSKYFKTLDLFPKKLKAVALYGPGGRIERVAKPPPVGNNGWNDLRDQLLCLDPLMVTTTEEPRYDVPTFQK
ncbi:unnamed protein product, partial [Brenthis ino]